MLYGENMIMHGETCIICNILLPFIKALQVNYNIIIIIKSF